MEHAVLKSAIVLSFFLVKISLGFFIFKGRIMRILFLSLLTLSMISFGSCAHKNKKSCYFKSEKMEKCSDKKQCKMKKSASCNKKDMKNCNKQCAMKNKS